MNRLLGIKVNGADLKLSTVMRINKTRCVSHRKALAQGKPTPGLNKSGITFRNRNRKTRRNKPSLERRKTHILRRAKIETRITSV